MKSLQITNKNKHAKTTKNNALRMQRGQSSANVSGSNTSPTLRNAKSTPAIRFDAKGGLSLPPSKPLFKLDMETVNQYDLPMFNTSNRHAKKAWATSSRTRGSPGLTKSSSKLNRISSTQNHREESKSPKSPTSPNSPVSPQTKSPPGSPMYDTSSRRSRKQSLSSSPSLPGSGMRRSSLSGAMDRMSMMKEMQKVAANRAENPTTGLEAIQYFAKQGEAAKQKFIYCIREECEDEAKWSPYDLVVVDADTAVSNGEHFIMSGVGLVHQIPGSPSDFLPTHEWVRGSVNYKVIRALRTFKMAKVIKTFHAWSKFTKHCKFIAKRTAGIGKAFIATSAFCPTIIRISGMLRDMGSVRLTERFKRVKSVAQSYQSGEFMRVQQETRSNGKDAIESITERIHSQVEDVCGEVTRRAELGDGGGTMGADGRRRSIVEVHAEKMAEAKHMSIHEAKLARARKKKQQKRWELEKRSLANFVKYIDYQLVTTLVTMCEKEANSLCELCHETERVGLFETTTRFRTDAVQITFQEAFRMNVEGCTEKGWSSLNASKTLVWPINDLPKHPTMKFTPSCASVHAMFLEVINSL